MLMCMNGLIHAILLRRTYSSSFRKRIKSKLARYEQHEMTPMTLVAHKPPMQLPIGSFFGDTRPSISDTDTEWITTNIAILIALTHQTRPSFSHLLLYGFPSALKPDDGEQIRADMHAYYKATANCSNSSTSQEKLTLKFLQGSSWQKLAKIHHECREILALCMRRNIPIAYAPSISSNPVNSCFLVSLAVLWIRMTVV
jgi:hypothetical protein